MSLGQPMRDHRDVIRESRDRLGLSYAQTAEGMGIEIESYWVVEAIEDELTTCLSLSEIAALCRILQWSCRDLLLTSASTAQVTNPPAELRRLIVEHLGQTGSTADEFADEVGWELSGFIENPTAVYHGWNIVALRDVCGGLGVDYVKFLPC